MLNCKLILFRALVASKVKKKLLVLLHVCGGRVGVLDFQRLLPAMTKPGK
jgi:hypothetical protein